MIQLNSQTFKVWADSARTKVKAVEKRTVYLDLNNSEFGPSTLTFDEHEAKGWYVESVTYQAWLQDPGQTGGEKKARQDWSISQESPNTSNLTGSISSGIDFSLSGGMFGQSVMATAGISYQQSHSHSLTDFTFYQHSDARVLRHAIQMSMTGDGTPYSTPNDLVEYDTGTVIKQFFQNPTAPILLKSLPGLAKSNVPVVGLAVWMNDSDSGLVDKLNLHLSMKARYILIKVWSDLLVHPKWSIADVNFEDDILLDFTLLS